MAGQKASAGELQVSPECRGISEEMQKEPTLKKVACRHGWFLKGPTDSPQENQKEDDLSKHVCFSKRNPEQFVRGNAQRTRPELVKTNYVFNSTGSKP